MEVSYSDERKAEMKNDNEKNCTLLISVLKHNLEKLGATNIEVWAPKNNDRFADIVFEFKVDSVEKLEDAKQTLKQIAGDSVGKIEVFLDEEDPCAC